MRGLSSLASVFKSNRGSHASGSGAERVEAKPANPASKTESPSSGPGLQRTMSNPARLPSNTPERTHVEPARPPISRAKPDTKPPKHFDRVLGIPRPFNPEASTKPARDKFDHIYLKPRRMDLGDILAEVKRNPELMGIIKERHPDFDNYTQNKQRHALNLIGNHPQYCILQAKVANKMHRLPSGPTATRMMTPAEQKFLTNASREINEQTRKNPFHIHGETGVTGTRDGEISRFKFAPGQSIEIGPEMGEKFVLHTHPPFMEPLTSSASVADHSQATFHYYKDDKRVLNYVTNGKDIVHIRPDSTELTKLIPDPKLEQTLGKLPVAFKVPDPEQPPYPFSNHEAPGAFKKWNREK